MYLLALRFVNSANLEWFYFLKMEHKTGSCRKMTDAAVEGIQGLIVEFLRNTHLQWHPHPRTLPQSKMGSCK